MTKITVRVLCVITIMILVLALPSFASDDPGSSQLKAFRERFKDLRTEADRLWTKMDSSPPDDYSTVMMLMEESNALSRRFMEFGKEVQSFDLSRQRAYRKRFKDSDAFLFLGAAAREMTDVLSSWTDFITDRRAIFLTAANKHREIVELFFKASQDAEVVNK